MKNKKIYRFFFRWLSITNHKDIGILYLLFGFIAEIIRILFSIIIRVELAYPGVKVLGGDWQFCNVVVTVYVFVLILMNLIFNIRPSLLILLSLNLVIFMNNLFLNRLLILYGLSFYIKKNTKYNV